MTLKQVKDLEKATEVRITLTWPADKWLGRTGWLMDVRLGIKFLQRLLDGARGTVSVEYFEDDMNEEEE